MNRNEESLIACALQDAATAREIVTRANLGVPMFETPKLARIWSALRRLLATEAGGGDVVEALGDVPDAVAAELAGEDDAPSLVDLHGISNTVPSAANWSYYAGRIRESYVRRESHRMIGEAEAERTREMDTAEVLAGVEARARHLREMLTGTSAAPVVVSAADYANTPQPAHVLWRDDPKAPDSTEVDAVLSVGEVAILASAGGLGKSTLTLDLASAAVAGADLDAAYRPACGLRVAAGPVVVVSYEDAPARIADRLTWANNGKVPVGVYLVPDPAPLWVAAGTYGGESRRGALWDALWRTVREIGARLVIIDPVSAALADVSTNETGPVRAFLRALTAEAARADGWHGCGVLLVAHDTKAARNAVRSGEDPGAGVVAGSAAWYDGARGVLSLMRDPVRESDDRLLECVKANYGRTGWGARLSERTAAAGTFRGLKLKARLDRADLGAAKRSPGGDRKQKHDKGDGSGAKVGPDVDPTEV